MKVVYDRETDTLMITLRDGRIIESDELRPGVIADFDADGTIMRIEVLDASVAVSDPGSIEYRAAITR